MSDDDPDDPFESFEAPDDREGDPFERLDDTEPADGTEGTTPAQQPDEDQPEPADGSDPDTAGEESAFEEEYIDDGDPFSTGADTAPTASSADGTAGGEDADALGDDDPFVEMDGREGDPFGGGESGFESVDIEGIDPDEIWESLEEEPTRPTVEGSRYAEVSKHRFCEQCEHFSKPPNAHCTHEEAEIIEYLDMETVRLLNCPIVAEQRELENEE